MEQGPSAFSIPGAYKGARHMRGWRTFHSFIKQIVLDPCYVPDAEHVTVSEREKDGRKKGGRIKKTSEWMEGWGIDWPDGGVDGRKAG